MKGLLIAFAIIGILTVLMFLGALMVHGSMMGMMHSLGNMMPACQAMMAAPQ